uniref:Uncharacterized protein n=1 Tax=Meloidogyne enterolobii TaxID=390850 RepID=A0A6V7VZE5_MELEN|nr:unnamed protein product [Meloidogyne enterolobii]
MRPKHAAPFKNLFVNKYFIYKFLLLMFEYFNFKKLCPISFCSRIFEKIIFTENIFN